MRHPFHRHLGRYFFFPEYRQCCHELQDNLDVLLDADHLFRHRSGFSDPVSEERKHIYDFKISIDDKLLLDCSPILRETLEFFDAKIGYWFINRLNREEMQLATPEYSNFRPHVDYVSSSLKDEGYRYNHQGMNPCKITLNLPITPMQGLRLETFEAVKYDAPYLPDRVANVQRDNKLVASKIPEKLLKRKRILDCNDPILLNSWQPHRIHLDENYWDTAEEECFRLCIRFAPKYTKDVQNWEQFYSDPWDLFATPFDISWKYWEVRCTR